MAQNFSAAVGAWASKAEKRMLAVFRESAQAVANEVRIAKENGGNMPVKLGNLRRSLMASTSAMPSVRAGKDQKFQDNDAQINLVIAGAEIGQTIYLGFQANYARRMEYGFTGEDSLGRSYNQQGNGFVRLTAQQWPGIVADSAWKIQRRTEARAAFQSMKSG